MANPSVMYMLNISYIVKASKLKQYSLVFLTIKARQYGVVLKKWFYPRQKFFDSRRI